MVNLFIETCPKDVEHMKSAYKLNNFKLIGEIAHKIKPSIDYLSTEDMSSKVREIEALERGEKVSSKSIDNFIQNIEDLISEMSQFRND